MGQKTCGVDGCERPFLAREMCSTHYARWKRLGSAGRAQIGRTVEERFWEKVARRGPDDCWEWLGFINKSGYGQFVTKREGGGSLNSTAQRTAYRLTKGEIPEGYQIDHLCFNRSCVNPTHLEAVTPAVNTARSSNPGARSKRTGLCKRGHAYAEHGYYGMDQGYHVRRCKICRLENERARTKRRRAADQAHAQGIGGAS